MTMWGYIAAAITLVIGAIGGFAAGVFYLRKQMEKMQNDPEMIQRMAKQMGYNVNKQQMTKIQQMMKNQSGKPGGKPRNRNFK